jgi:hypothetical protein
VLLELLEELLVVLLDKQLVRLVVYNHLQLAQVQCLLSSCQLVV